MTYHMGQTVPFDYKRGLTGPELPEPVWNAIVVPPMKERGFVGVLKAQNVFGFYPKRERSHTFRGRKITREYPEVSRIVYAKFKHQPNYDVMKARRLITGVFSVGENPINIPASIIRQLQGLPDRVEALRQARDELRQLIVGEVVQIAEGPAAGHCVQIAKVDPSTGEVHWHSLASSFLRGSSSANMLVKRDEPSEADVQQRADEIQGLAGQG